MSTTQFGAAVGVASQTIDSWEGGKTEPRSSSLAAAAHVLGCAMEDLFAPVTDDEAPEGTS